METANDWEDVQTWKKVVRFQKRVQVHIYTQTQAYNTYVCAHGMSSTLASFEEVYRPL